MIISFIAVILLSLALAIGSRRGQQGQDARAFFTASGQLGTLLLFFLSVGETYSIASMLGFPGGVFAHGEGFSAWFFGYILLSAPILFFLGPLIATAGRRYDAATLPDFFARHYRSRALELVIALAAILALVPVGTMQFTGLKIVFATLAPAAPPMLLIGGAGVLAFCYVAIAGLRTSAFVAVLKDLLMIASILLVSGLALGHWQEGAATPVATPPITPKELRFAFSTIAVQALGYALLPQTWSALFAAKSAETIRRAQAAAPLYMIMFPLLTGVATYALRHGLHPPAPDHVFLTVAASLLPGWLQGIVLASVALAGLVLITTVCLAIGSLVTRNLLPDLPGAAQQSGAKLVTIAYLGLSIAFAEGTGKLMATMNNIIYFGIAQLAPGLAAALVMPRVPPVAIIAGIVTGNMVAMALFAAGIDVGGINPGLIGLAANIAVMIAVTLVRPRAAAPSLLSQLQV